MTIGERIEALEKENAALKEEHRQLVGWLEELKKLREQCKAVSPKFLRSRNVEGLSNYPADNDAHCPRCGEDLTFLEECEYCPQCGQALSWEYPDEEDDEE